MPRTLLESVLNAGAQMNNNGFAATGSASTSSSTAAFDAFLNVIADSANKTAPAAAAAAPNVDQNPWTSEPPKRSTNPFRWSIYLMWLLVEGLVSGAEGARARFDSLLKMAQWYFSQTFKGPVGADFVLPVPASSVTYARVCKRNLMKLRL